MKIHTGRIVAQKVWHTLESPFVINITLECFDHGHRFMGKNGRTRSSGITSSFWIPLVSGVSIQPNGLAFLG